MNEWNKLHATGPKRQHALSSSIKPLQGLPSSATLLNEAVISRLPFMNHIVPADHDTALRSPGRRAQRTKRHSITGASALMASTV